MVTDTPKINAVVNTLLQDFEYVFEVRPKFARFVTL